MPEAGETTLSPDAFDAAGMLYDYVIGPDGFQASGDEPHAWRWNGFALTDARARSCISAMTGLPEEVRESLLDSEERAFVDREQGWVFGALPDIRHRHYENAPDLGLFRFAFDGRLLITARRRPLQTIDDIRNEVETRKRPYASPGAVIDAVLKRLLDFLTAEMQRLFHEIDSIEDRIIGDSWASERERLAPLRRRANTIHRHLFMLSSLLRYMQSGQIRVPEIDSADFAARALGLLHDSEQLQAHTRQLQEEIMARLSERTNKLLYVLSVLTAVLMPATIITGVFGMNLQGIPFEAEHHGFWVAVFLSLASSAGVLMFVWMMTGRD